MITLATSLKIDVTYYIWNKGKHWVRILLTLLREWIWIWGNNPIPIHLQIKVNEMEYLSCIILYTESALDCNYWLFVF